GSDGLDAAEVVVDDAVCLTGTAVPPVVFPQPTATPPDRQITQAVPSAMHPACAGSVARKRKSNFLFHVHRRPAPQVDIYLGARATGEHERRFVATGPSRTAVAPDGDAGTSQPERSGVGAHIGKCGDFLIVDEQRQVTERSMAVCHGSGPR